MTIKNVIIVTFATAVLFGCRASHLEQRYLNQNIATGRQIVLCVNVYSQDARDTFPGSLGDLVTEGLLKSIPRCICEDGKSRDFIYVPNFSPSDGWDSVILASPLEMDSKQGVIFHADARSEVVSKEMVVSEIKKSRAYTMKLGRKPR